MEYKTKASLAGLLAAVCSVVGMLYAQRVLRGNHAREQAAQAAPASPQAK
jgi:hypothetical protein